MTKKQISKFMSGLLRHFPDEYDLDYSSDGWFDVMEVLDCIQEKYNSVSVKDIETIVNEDSKGRYEFDSKKNRIRAVYGHSIDIDIEDEEDNDIPDVLYHGTPISNKSSILNVGLQPQSRQKVHLTEDKNEAKKVGKRHSDDILVFSINTSELINDGFKISNPSGNSVYTISEVPAKYLTIE